MYCRRDDWSATLLKELTRAASAAPVVAQEKHTVARSDFITDGPPLLGRRGGGDARRKPERGGVSEYMLGASRMCSGRKGR